MIMGCKSFLNFKFQGPCAECTEIQASLANSFQMTSLNESDGIPRHILIYLCSNGDMFQAVPVQRCSSVSTFLEYYINELRLCR